MDFQDKVLKCIDCGSDFVFTAGEQLFFHDKQFKNEPKRCKACKAKRISVLGATTPGQVPNRTETRTTCSQCGKKPRCPLSPPKGGPSFVGSAFSKSGNSRLPPPEADKLGDPR